MDRNRLHLWAWMLILALAIVGCGDDDDPVTPQPVDEFALAAGVGDVYFTDYMTPNLGLSVNTTAAAVWTELNAKATDYYIIDWRSAEHYAYAHIDGAVNMALGDLVQNLPNIPTGKVILNVCYTGQTASTATAILNMLGRDAQNLKFGMYGWVSADRTGEIRAGTERAYPIVDTYDGWMDQVPASRPAAGTLPSLDTGKSTALEILTARADTYVRAGWKNRTIDAVYPELISETMRDDWFVLNYFPVANYNAGHIPGAIRYQPNNDLKSGEFLNTLPTDKKILVYCWTGQTSAQVTAYLNMLGYDAYSLLYGVHSMCANNAGINTKLFQHPAAPGYPTVGSGVM